MKVKLISKYFIFYIKMFLKNSEPFYNKKSCCFYSASCLLFLTAILITDNEINSADKNKNISNRSYYYQFSNSESNLKKQKGKLKRDREKDDTTKKKLSDVTVQKSENKVPKNVDNLKTFEELDETDVYGYGNSIASEFFIGILRFDVGTPNAINLLVSDVDSYAGTFVTGNEDEIYWIDNENNYLKTYNIQNNLFHSIGELEPVDSDEIWADMATDYTDGTTYVMSTSINESVDRLYKIDINNAELEEIGTFHNGGSIALAIDDDGEAYVHSITSNAIYSLDLQTAEIERIGPTGIQANFAQSMDFDHETGQLLMAAYYDCDERCNSTLRYVDRQNGNTTPVGQIADGRSELGWFTTAKSGTTAPDEDPFITIWQTDNEGASDDDRIVIPGEGEEYLIEWEEVGNPGNSGSETGSGEHTITFPEPGQYRVEISGDFHRIHLGKYEDAENSDALKLLEVEQWGDIEWSSMEEAFGGSIHPKDYGAENLEITAEDSPDLSNVESMADMFAYAKAMNNDISDWDTGNVTDMGSMFRSAEIFDQDIGRWDTGNVEDMSRMFREAELFNQDIGAWDVSSVSDMNDMFNNAKSFNQDISGWDVSNVTDMQSMFFSADSFNQDISNWDIGNVEVMSWMFHNADSFKQDIGDWDTGNVEEMVGMFAWNNTFNQDISGWNTSNVTNMARMFRGAASFNQDIGDWNVSEVSSMWVMFEEASSFDQDISDWDVSTVEEMGGMFDRSNFSSENYDLALISWSKQQLNNNLTLGAEGIHYCEAEEERQQIIDEFGWIIRDEGIDSDCVIPPELTLLNAPSNEPRQGEVELTYQVEVGQTGGSAVNEIEYYYAIDADSEFSPAEFVEDDLTQPITNQRQVDVTWSTSQEFPDEESDEVVFKAAPVAEDGLKGDNVTTRQLNIDNKAPRFDPSSVDAEVHNTNEINLSWQEAEDLNSVEYKIFYALEDQSYDLDDPDKVVNDNEASISGVYSASPYRIKVLPVDEVGNRFEEDHSVEVTTSIIGDYTHSGSIESEDVHEFVDAFTGENLERADIYPYEGEIPHIQVIGNDDLGVHDLIVFTHMWNWSAPQRAANFDSKVDQIIENDSIPVINQELKPDYDNQYTIQLKPTIDKKMKNWSIKAKWPESIKIDTVGVNQPGIPMISINREKQSLVVDHIAHNTANKEEPYGYSSLSSYNSESSSNPDKKENDNNFLNLDKKSLDEANKDLMFQSVDKNYNLEDGLLNIELDKNIDEENEELILLFVAYDKDGRQHKSLYSYEFKEELPEEIVLSQNYPNPFNNSTTIEYHLPEATHVKISVYDVLGRHMQTLKDENQDAGEHAVQLNTNGWASGTYIYRLETEEFSDNRQMMLVK